MASYLPVSTSARVVDLTPRQLRSRDFLDADLGLDSEQDEEEEGDAVVYSAVYAASLVILAVGVLMWVTGQVQSVVGGRACSRQIIGTGLLVTGAFLILNSDLVVTFLRFQRELGRFKANNAELEENLKDQAEKVRDLRLSAELFEKLDKDFGGSVDQMKNEVESMKATNRSRIHMNVKLLCQLYCDADRDKLIDLGDELDDTLKMLETVMCPVYADFPLRAAQTKQAIENDEGCSSAGGIPVQLFSEAVSCAVEQPTSHGARDAVSELLAGEAK